MATPPGHGNRTVKRRIAATAATAALALSGSAATRPATARTLPSHPGEGAQRLAHSNRAEAETALELARRSEMAGHRQRLAGALAAELPGSAPRRIEHALAAADSEIGDAYARGERPRFVAGLPAVMAAASGVSEARLADAFESMSRKARERRRAAGSGD